MRWKRYNWKRILEDLCYFCIMISVAIDCLFIMDKVPPLH